MNFIKQLYKAKNKLFKFNVFFKIDKFQFIYKFLKI